LQKANLDFVNTALVLIKNNPLLEDEIARIKEKKQGEERGAHQQLYALCCVLEMRRQRGEQKRALRQFVFSAAAAKLPDSHPKPLLANISWNLKEMSTPNKTKVCVAKR
jgi:hypothetical protein